MADVKWIKIVTDIFDDEKVLLIESLPEADALIVIWFKLLCLAGKQNNQGVFLLNNRIPYTDEMLATIFRRNVATVRLALSTFENFGMIEIIDGVITIPNWSKHQSLDQLEKKREYMRNYMAEKRKEQKALCDATGESNCKTNSKTNCKTNSKSNVSSLDKNKIRIEEDKNNILPNKSEIESDFEELWSLYPNKQGKSSALKKYQSLIKNGKATKEIIADGIIRYNEYISRNKVGKEFIKHGSTFFNQECWNDDYNCSGGSVVDSNGRVDIHNQSWSNNDPTVI